MEKSAKEQFEKIKELYKSGQVEYIKFQLLKVISYEERERYIQICQESPQGAFMPIDKEMKELLTELIIDGELDMALEELTFMTRDAGRRYLWSCRKNDARGPCACNKSQYKRLRSLVREKCIDYRSDEQLKRLSFSEAKELIAEGEENMLIRKIRS